ncbi:MAG: FtsX-like permease family protein [Paludibacter sp.]|nr:FtsX-like permease family protein [Paludibacter sp.]
MEQPASDLKTKWRKFSFSLRIARRYLFSKKSHNAINIISGLSATGVAIGTLALVVVMSVFNGFDSLVTDMFSAFDPELKITLVQGKTFSIDSPEFKEIKAMKSVAVFTPVLEDNALLAYKDKQMPVVVKGVDANYNKLTSIDSIMYDGDFLLYDGGFERTVVGAGVASLLGVGAKFIDPLYFYAPKREGNINLLQPERSMNEIPAFISGIFLVNQVQYDDHYVLVSMNFARDLFNCDSTTVSAVEIKIAENQNEEDIQKQIKSILGNKFHVKNRYEQQENFYKIMKIEKWFTFLILSFILLIASFNIIGSLSMLIIDKKGDIQTFRSLGANNRLIKRIFLFEGWLISIVGALAGLILGTLACFIQEYFGIVKLGAGYVVEAYPVVTDVKDIILVFITVLFMGFLAAWYPVRYINKTLFN